MNIQVLASGSKGNCYIIESSGNKLMLECGLSFARLQKASGFNLSDLDGCLITHEHKDHCYSVKDLLRRGVDCFMSPGTKKALSLDNHRANTVCHGNQFNVGEWRIVPFHAVHDAQEPLGFLVVKDGYKLLFATDTAYIRPRFQGLTHIMVECNYCRDILTANVDAGYIPSFLRGRIIFAHLELDNVIGFLEAQDLSRVQEIYLLHLSNDNSDAARMKREVQQFGIPVTVTEA